MKKFNQALFLSAALLIASAAAYGDTPNTAATNTPSGTGEGTSTCLTSDKTVKHLPAGTDISTPEKKAAACAANPDAAECK
jgi:hypothetical protein